MEATYRANAYYPEHYPAVLSDLTPAAFDSPPLIEFETGYTYIRGTSITCDFSSQNCYTLKVHPRVDYLEKSYGSSNGGQRLKIYGTGFGINTNDVQVFIDDIECDVTAVTSGEIKCVTG